MNRRDPIVRVRLNFFEHLVKRRVMIGSNRLVHKSLAGGASVAALVGVIAMSKSKVFVALAGLGMVFAVTNPALANPPAAGTWAHRHPRQHEVLAREHRQMHSINHERRESEVTRGQARAMRSTDRSIARQDHADARAHGGRITRREQHQINREENAQSAAIGH